MSSFNYLSSNSSKQRSERLSDPEQLLFVDEQINQARKRHPDAEKFVLLLALPRQQMPQ
eukprot:CAMPEP_0168325068 /NCGR_PEP_ID=MMETSP0213-20121227/4474_1 /TAXON_ID=151035 /ORGANISM="Euplotes harpa, Strain FSP1.4" /LENGTH=58 /DNA_ID=CAMNT_0008327495 /DNA_START=56 /DNA_END=232 /DNA_ORIENTATION=+